MAGLLNVLLLNKLKVLDKVVYTVPAVILYICYAVSCLHYGYRTLKGCLPCDSDRMKFPQNRCVLLGLNTNMWLKWTSLNMYS